MLEALPKEEKPTAKVNEIRLFQQLQTQKWYSWITLNEQGPRKIMLTGEVQGYNAGHKAILLKKMKSVAEDILSLELILTQEEGNWAEIDCWIPLDYQAYMFGNFYTTVHVHFNGQLIEKIPIDILASTPASES